MDTPKRYHPSMVILHWVIAILVFFNLYVGFFILRSRGGGFNFATRNTFQAAHMVVGITVLVLLTIRLIFRFILKRPNSATAGNAILDFIAKVVHYALYFFLFVMTLSGLIFSLQTNRFQFAFSGTGDNPRFNGPPSGFTSPNGNFRTPVPGGASNFSGNPGQPGNNPGFSGRDRGPRFTPLELVHATTATVLLLLIGLHILAALYHQFIRRDRLFARMWFGAR